MLLWGLVYKNRGGQKMDIKLHYTERGEGRTADPSAWKRRRQRVFRSSDQLFFKYVSGNRHRYTGTWQVAEGEKPFTIRQFAEDLKGFMDEHLIEKANVLGFSDGEILRLYLR